MNNPQNTKPKQEIGDIMPEIELPCVSGGKRSLSSIFEGKRGAVVVFWSETCSHCIHYDPYLSGFAGNHPELGMIVVACRIGENLDEIRETAVKRNLKFPILHDSDGSIAKQWFVQQTPRVFLMDGERRLLYRGAIDNFRYPDDKEFQAYLEPAIASFLAGKPIERTETASFGCAVQSVYYILPKPMA